jgi:drug/metabolite transporter (DMT)-like permease
MSDEAHNPNAVRAIVLICGAGLSFAVLDATVKYLSARTDLPMSEITWVRFFVHGLLTLVILGPAALPRLMKSSKPLQQWLRSGFMLTRPPQSSS